MPRNYLDFEQEGIAKAKYDFEAKTPVEISFKKVIKKFPQEKKAKRKIFANRVRN